MRSVEGPETVGVCARRLERVGPAMQAYVDRGVYAGVSTLIARRGRSSTPGSSAGATRKRRRR